MSLQQLSNSNETETESAEKKKKKKKQCLFPMKEQPTPKTVSFRYTEHNGTAASQGKQLIQLLPTFSCRMNTVQELVPWTKAKTTISDMVKTPYWPKIGGVFVVYHYITSVFTVMDFKTLASIQNAMYIIYIYI